MALERHYRSLFLLISLPLLLYSFYCSSRHVLAPVYPFNAPTFSLLRHNLDDHPYNFTLTIKVLTFDRIVSLSRCLRSLAKADYSGDTVNLHVYIDHFAHTVGENNTDPSILDKKMENSQSILKFVDGFSWKYGDKMVHYRTGNAGLQAQWLEAWWPRSDNEFAFIVEDDLEVSPLYYRFLRRVIVYFYWNTSNFSPSIYGVSLQRPRFVAGKHGNKMQFDNGTRLLLYQLVGTWGQLLFPKPWKEFRLWYDTKKAKGIKPHLQGMITSGWYNKMGEKIWTPWFIKFIHSRGYFNLYTNFLGERALSVSHRDAGVNYRKSAGPDSYLLNESTIDFDLQEMQALRSLKWYDFCFKEVHPGTTIQTFAELGSTLHSLQKESNIIFVSLFGVPEAITKNLLCHFERLNVYNYIIVGQKSNLLLDLIRRGHPAIDVDCFLSGIIGFKGGSMKEIIIKAYLIKKSLECGYHSWVIDGNMVFAKSDWLSDVVFSAYDFVCGEITGLFFARSSSSSKRIWSDDLIYRASAMLSSVNFRGERSLVHVMGKLLSGHEGARIIRINERRFGMKINTNKTSLGNKDKLVFWPPELNTKLVQQKLAELGMWIVDEDFSCTAVVCHHHNFNL